MEKPHGTAYFCPKKGPNLFWTYKIGRHYPTKGQSHVHRMNLGFGPTRSRKDEKEAEKKKLQNKLEKVARNANVYTNLT